MINKIFKPIFNKLPENNRIERIWKTAQTDFKKRYYNDRLGLFWALLNPILKIIIYFLVFTYVLNRAQENFVLFLFAGFVIWMTFTEISMKSLGIIKAKKYLIENIQFNHVDLFLSLGVSVFLGLSFNTAAYFIFCFFEGIYLCIYNLWIIPIFLILYILSIGIGMILATIKIYIKDIQHAWAIIVLAGFWGSGIFFPAQKIIDLWPPMLYINPFIGLIQNFRKCTMHQTSPDLYILFINLLYALIMFFLGKYIYNKFSHKAIELI